MTPIGKPKSKEKIRTCGGKRILRRKGIPRRKFSETPPGEKLAPKISTNKVWENIVIHYLNKLKNSWRSNGDQNANCAEFRRGHYKRCRSIEHSEHFDRLSLPGVSKSQSTINSLDTVDISKKKALNIVTNAIEYGHAKGLVSRNGKFFWLRTEKPEPKPAAAKSPTKDIQPRVHTVYKNCRKSISFSSTSTNNSRKKKYWKARTKHPAAFRKFKKRAHKTHLSSDSDCSCSKCRNTRY